MRVVELELTNYRVFEHVHLELPDGVVGLVGRNGSGKSTLVEAVTWALFGHEAARTTKEEIKRRGAAPGEDVRVTLRFQFAGHTYEVVRELRGANLTPSAEVHVDGQVQVQGGAGSFANVTQHLVRTFHMDRDAFFTSVVARQKELDALSDMRPGERKEVVLRMLRIDAVDEAIRRCRQRKRDLRTRLEHLEDALEALPTAREELESAREELDAARERLHDASEAEEEAEATAATLREHRDALADARDTYQELGARRQRLRDRVSSLEESLEETRREHRDLQAAAEELQELEPREEAYHEARERLQELETRRDRHQERRRLEERVEEARQRLSDLTTRQEELEGKLEAVEDARGELEALRERREDLRSELQRNDAALTRLHTVLERHVEEADDAWTRRQELRDLGTGTPCPTCERPLDEDHLDAVLQDVEDHLIHHLESIRGAVDRVLRVRKEAGGIRGWIRDLRSTEEELETRVTRASRLEGTLSEVQGEADEAREALRTARKRLDDVGAVPYDADEHRELQERLEELTEHHERVVQLRARLQRREEVEERVTKLEKELETARRKLATVGEELEELDFDPEAYRDVETRLEEAQRAAAEAGKQRVAAEGTVERAELVLERAREEVERLEGLEEQVEDEREDLRYLERLAGDRDSGILVDFKVHLISRIRPVLARLASDLFRDLTDGRYSALELDEDYDVLVHDQGEVYSLDRFSGGESDLANLCVRLAIGQVIADRAGDGELNFLALDEVFGSQDATRRGNILRALSNLSSRFRQILVITHVEEVRDSVDALYHVVEDEDGSHRVVLESG